MLNNETSMEVGFVGGMPFCLQHREDTDSPISYYNKCDAAISQMVIASNGDCRPCVEMPWSGGNILCDTVESIWESKIFKDIRLFKNVPKDCYNCKVVSRCHGGCRAAAYNQTGDIIARSHLMPAKIPSDYLIHVENSI